MSVIARANEHGKWRDYSASNPYCTMFVTTWSI
jgi:hypothetical protein